MNTHQPEETKTKQDEKNTMKKKEEHEANLNHSDN